VSKYESLKPSNNEDPEDKLRTLRSSIRTCNTTINGFAQIIKKVAKSTPDALPDEFEDWIDKIIQASKDIDEIIEILTGPP
jgi:hypothetical protein